MSNLWSTVTAIFCSGFFMSYDTNKGHYLTHRAECKDQLEIHPRPKENF